MNEDQFDLRQSINYGLIAGLITLAVSAIGMVELFGQRDLIAGVLTVGQVLIFLGPALFSYMASNKAPADRLGRILLSGLVCGVVAAVPTVLFILIASQINLRQFFPNVSPALMVILTFGQGSFAGSLLLLVAMGAVGLAASVFSLLPERFRKAIQTGLIWTLGIGLFSEILSGRLRDFFGVGFTSLIFTSRALIPYMAGVIFLLVVGISYWWNLNSQSLQNRISQSSTRSQRRYRIISIGLIVVLMLVLPLLLGTYLSEVTNNIMIFILMGLGLNIVVGFAGLLDLGYVAFFAIGAYTMAILTTEGSLGFLGLSFWAALPICVAVAVLAGVLLGMPVLRMRGDYLAIVTLGFGEIIRILALSDLLKPYIGGAQGVLQIPKPSVFGVSLFKPEQLYYVILGGILLAIFVSWRLSNARIGRQWMALREDEDVAEAMGINLVNTKLLAFAIGAAFSGFSGAIFASKLTSIFPHSFSLFISIYVLCLIIVGGIGSLPGVIVGAVALIGLPELLREFAEYRNLMFGAVLIAMMLLKPEGFWPSEVRRRELRPTEETAPVTSGRVPETVSTD